MRSISSESFILFNQQLASMVVLDMPLPESLRRTSSELRDRRLSATVASMAREVERGGSLSSAVAKHSNELPLVYAALVKAGEAGGNLAEVLRQVASYSQDMLAIENKVKANLIYPAMLMLGFLCLAPLFAVVIVPSFERIFSNFGARLPWLTEVVIGVCGFVSEHMGLLLGAAGATAAAACARRRELASWWQEFQLKVPWWNDFALSTVLARFCGTLGLLLKNAVPVADALTLTEAAVENRVVARAVASARAAVVRGEKLGPALAKTGVFPQTLAWLLAAAEEREDLEDCLVETGAYYDKKADRIARMLTGLIEPVLIVALGLAVGTVIISLFMPMFGLGELASNMEGR